VRIEVKLFATLSRFLPGPSNGQSATVDLPDGSTVNDLLESLGIPTDLPAVLLVNGRDAAPGQVLRHGDELAMFPPLAGGQ
jgi:molybdopterin converting factor small subunit